MDYYLVRETIRNHGQDQKDLIIGITLKDFMKTNSDNILHLHKNICNNIGSSIINYKTKSSDFSDWRFLLNDVIPRSNVCAGKYLDCKHNEISANDLNIFLSNGQTNNNSSILPFSHQINKCVEEKTNYMDIDDSKCINLARNNENSNKSIKPESKENDFKTALQELEQKQKTGQTNHGQKRVSTNGTTKRYLGSRYLSKIPGVPTNKKEEVQVNDTTNLDEDDRLRNIDENMIKLICNEIMYKFKPINWDDIAGLEYAKSSIQEAVVWPILRPDIFTGLRRPPRGILLFGPPGTGKTLIGKCIASQSKSTFFSISASSLTSKWFGEGEKMVRALFAVAVVKQPSVVFIDEIDSLLCQRSESENEGSRRIKTEFLVQLDGAGTRENERLLIVGATNRPQELDEAARRRFVRRLYIPLPEFEARIQILKNLLLTERNEVTETQFNQIGQMSEGYSAADMESLCREASMEPIRSIPARDIPVFNEKNVRSVNYNDFLTAFKRVRTSVSPDELEQYEKWNNTFGANK